MDARTLELIRKSSLGRVQFAETEPTPDDGPSTLDAELQALGSRVMRGEMRDPNDVLIGFTRAVVRDQERTIAEQRRQLEESRSARTRALVELTPTGRAAMNSSKPKA